MGGGAGHDRSLKHYSWAGKNGEREPFSFSLKPECLNFSDPDAVDVQQILDIEKETLYSASDCIVEFIASGSNLASFFILFYLTLLYPQPHTSFKYAFSVI